MDLILDLLLKFTLLNTFQPGRIIKKHRQFIQKQENEASNTSLQIPPSIYISTH